MSATTMVMMLPVPSGPSGVRRVRISLPLVPFLVDGQRYFQPDDLPPAEGQDLRALSRPRIDRIGRAMPERRNGPLWTAHDRGPIPARRRRDQAEAEAPDPV